MSIQNFFEGKNILITGGSGFIGKVLIEKLLRSCHSVGSIYVLLREKKGQAPEERLKGILDNTLFAKLKSKNPDALKKLIPISGDVKECQLALSEENRQIIIDNVNIIYHGAASVKFDDFLKDAILLNTRGTRELVELALQMKHLVAFIHISTTYCHTDKKIIEEKMYPPHADWRASIQIAEEVEKHALDILATKYIEPLQNTYTFSKSLSEHVVNDLCKGKIPTVIFRPSVVISTHSDPECGWVDNFNGPVGLLTAGGKGLTKVYYGDLDVSLDLIPVDLLVKMLIVSTFKRSLNKDLSEVEVYNAAGGKELEFSNRALITVGKSLTWNAPTARLFWYPTFTMTSNWYLFYIGFLIYHILPAILADGILKLIGKSPLLIKIQRRIYIANMALRYFTSNAWTFKNDKLTSRNFHSFVESEIDAFSYYRIISECTEAEKYAFYLKGKIAAMVCLFKEEFDMNIGFRNTIIMWILDRLVHFIVYGLGCWYLFTKVDIVTVLCNKFNDFSLYLNKL